MMQIILTRLGATTLIAALLIGALGLLERRAEQRGYDRRELEYQAAESAAQDAARATEARQIETLTGAINEHTQSTNRNQADAVATHVERDRVHNAFAQHVRDLSSASADACTVDRTAYGKLLEAVGQAVDQLAEDAERIALDADGHAADSLMYQRIGGIAPP
jgi:hypothetical protein